MNQSFLDMARSLNELYKTMYALYAPDVERIIKNNIIDEDQIESCLENLLNCPTDECYELFLKLCTYYKKINKKSAEEYIEIYKELYLDDEEYEEESTTKKRK